MRNTFGVLLLLSGTALSQTATNEGPVDPTLVTVLGGGISAGFADFHLTQVFQQQAWPVVAVRQMGGFMSVPALRESGPSNLVNAYRPLAGLAPFVPQSGERAFPFQLLAMNLSIPFLRTGDALRLKPQPRFDGNKLIVAIEGDTLTTMVNVVLGGPLLILRPPVLQTQVEYAESLVPTLSFIQLGFEDVVEAATTNNAARITSVASFTSDYQTIVRRIAATGAKVVVMTVPDPMDTAYFATTDELGQRYGIAGADLRTRFGLAAGDAVTLAGMVEIGNTLRGRRQGVLPAGSVVSASVVSAVQSAVTGYNAAIKAEAQTSGAGVFELGEFLRQIRTSGTRAGNVAITGAFGGGFYSQDGLYPAPAGQALIANALLQFLNTRYRSSFQPAPVPAPVGAPQ
jgi:hypothetical protein